MASSLFETFVLVLNLYLPQEKRIVIQNIEQEQPQPPLVQALDDQNNVDQQVQPKTPFFGRPKRQNDRRSKKRDHPQHKKQIQQFVADEALREDEKQIKKEVLSQKALLKTKQQRIQKPKEEKTELHKRSRDHLAQLQSDSQNFQPQQSRKKKLKTFTNLEQKPTEKPSGSSKKQKRSKYFDPKPYVMRKIKFYVKKTCSGRAQKDHRLTEEHFRRNINEDFYRKIIFLDYNKFLDKGLMFDEIRNQWLHDNEGFNARNNNFSTEQRKLILGQIKRVQLLYSYDTKSIQKTMWSALQLSSQEISEVKSFMRTNYSEIAEILKNSDKISSEEFWEKVQDQLIAKNPLKYDSFGLEKIKSQYFQ